VHGSANRSSGSKICFGDVASPDARVAAVVLTDDEDHEKDVITEDCWRILDGVKGKNIVVPTSGPNEEGEGGQSMGFAAKGIKCGGCRSG